MPPPPAELFASRIFLGPALRAQPDGRLVGLVREGHDSAFEEIVRRYRRPLERFAAAIVGGRSEDVTQDAFSKALLALRGSETEIELRPWLYRIVRNTALNDLRDRGPSPEQLSEALAGAGSAAATAELREELSDLMKRLRALPEPQRAALVMRELEGLGHDEIAAALGVSGGAARQAIYRARATLRDGLGLLVPMPVLRALIDHGGDATRSGGAIAAGAGASSAGSALGGLGAGGALKLGAATLLVAGTVAGGVAIEQHRSAGPEAAAAAPLAEKSSQHRRSARANSAAPRGGKNGPGDAAGRRGGDASGRHGDQSGPESGGNLSTGSGTRATSHSPSSHSGGSGEGHGGSGSGGESGQGGGDHSGLQTNGSGDGSGDGGSSGGSGSDDGSLTAGGGSGGEDGTSSGSSGEQTTTTSEPMVEATSGETESSSGSGSSGDGSGDLSGSGDATESTTSSEGSP